MMMKPVLMFGLKALTISQGTTAHISEESPEKKIRKLVRDVRSL